MRKRYLLIILLGFVLLSMFFDSKDLEDEQALYCSNVEQGVWPDFDGTYRELCRFNTR